LGRNIDRDVFLSIKALLLLWNWGTLGTTTSIMVVWWQWPKFPYLSVLIKQCYWKLPLKLNCRGQIYYCKRCHVNNITIFIPKFLL
jgi:hypothetical protein